MLFISNLREKDLNEFLKGGGYSFHFTCASAKPNTIFSLLFLSNFRHFRFSPQNWKFSSANKNSTINVNPAQRHQAMP
jgi:hypothetical protein